MRALFQKNGVHCVVDGQFGSTGKGVLAAWLAQQAIDEGVIFSYCVSNAGPNSGHTFYHGPEKHVLKQLPTFAVASYLLGNTVPVILSAGAIIDLAILLDEANRYGGIPIYVHPQAALITQYDQDAERVGTIAAVAGTRSGTGAVLARKVQRDPAATIGGWLGGKGIELPVNVSLGTPPLYPFEDRIFMEVSQGFSLGLNSQFYPKVTSRECTVMQGISDARLPPRSVTRTYLSMRTYPIRVGNVDGYSSGDFYHDQEETSWEALGVEPELTTVTKRIRRVFTFSYTQAHEAILANDPDFVFMNFMNYLDPYDQDRFEYNFNKFLATNAERDVTVIGGYGATSEDVRRW